MQFNFTLPRESSRARAAHQRIALRTTLSAAMQITDDLVAADTLMCAYIAKRAECVFTQPAVGALLRACRGWLFPHSKGGAYECMPKYFPDVYQMLLN